MIKIKIKAILFIGLFVMLLLPAAVFADEVTEVWAQIYNQAHTLHQKYEIMLSIVELDNRDAVPVLMGALEEVNQMKLYLDEKDMVIQNNLKTLIINELGDLRAAEAAPLIYRVMRETKDPYLKGEALIALGETGARRYAEDIALILRNKTLYRGDDLRGEEAIVYGCIVALERMNDPAGYLPVFLALNSGFSRKIKKTAESALPNILDDPSEVLKHLIKTDSSLKVKLAALSAEYRSDAPVEKKLAVAYEALNQSLIVKTSSVKDHAFLREIRLLAMEMFINYEIDYSGAVPLIEQVLYLNYDSSETIYAIESLRAIPSIEAAEALSRFLAFQNDRQEAGFSDHDNVVVIATIRAMGNANGKVSPLELLRAKYSGYPAIVAREADKAMSSL